MPWDTVVFLLCFFYATFQPAVGEGVAFVELEIAFVRKETATVVWGDAFDSVSCNKCSREVNEVLPPRLKRDTLVPYHGKLSWLADEQLEGDVLLGQGAQGQRVRVEVQPESQSVPDSLLRLQLLGCFTPLQLFHQVLVF